MTPTIQVSDELYGKLQALGGSLFGVSEVIEKLLEARGNGSTAAGHVDSAGPRVRGRVPRERGVTVDLDDLRIHADSVRDLYGQVLSILTDPDRGYAHKIEPLIPYGTRAQRYLIAKEPVHPTGRDFSVPVDRNGLYMETHKSYKTAIKQLGQFLAKAGIRLRYVG